MQVRMRFGPGRLVITGAGGALAAASLPSAWIECVAAGGGEGSREVLWRGRCGGDQAMYGGRNAIIVAREVERIVENDKIAIYL